MRVYIEDVCEILDSRRIPITASNRKAGPYPYLGANGIQDYVADYIFDDDLVLLAEDGGNFCSKERPIAYRASGKCWVNNHAHVLKPKPGLDVDYLCYSLMFYDVSNLINGATRQKLTQSDMRKMQISYPVLEEQKIIVSQLNAVGSLIIKRLQQLTKLDELVKSRFIELFGDPVANPIGWPIRELSEFIEFLTSGSRGWAKYFTNEGEYFITIKNVKNCKITLNDVQHIVPPDNAEARRTKVQEGDLLISITADLGRTGVVLKEIAEHGAYINQHLTCIRLNKAAICPLYVAYYMESEAGKSQFQAKNQSAVKAGLNFNAINTLKLMVPPIELQKEFISFVERTDKSKLAIQKSLDQLETLKKALMQQYFG
ncbi:restriction endonuclease subunit S [Oscillibacter sp. MSJ-2]|uniref:Restriction endonuclease subunit S n=1 Tax=Dysosmobacter acutus TaxID=2841504 RepID=A0ABS6FBZ1_9FIRM|nr:restriction endonuclease subunit S [Dysosmobacter acutus]MBU5627672.1 restriction endonuclease subunit S [Dysosmobacter acutus]